MLFRSATAFTSFHFLGFFTPTIDIEPFKIIISTIKSTKKTPVGTTGALKTHRSSFGTLPKGRLSCGQRACLSRTLYRLILFNCVRRNNLPLLRNQRNRRSDHNKNLLDRNNLPHHTDRISLLLSF